MLFNILLFKPRQYVYTIIISMKQNKMLRIISSVLGSALMQIVEVYKEIQAQQMNIVSRIILNYSNCFSVTIVNLCFFSLRLSIVT